MFASFVLACGAGVDESDPSPDDPGTDDPTSEDPADDDPESSGRVSLEIVIIGDGQIQVEPSGTTCMDSCQVEFDAGTEVTLTPPTHVNAEAGDIVLARWNSTCDAVGPCALKLSKDTRVEALFGTLREETILIDQATDDALQDPGGSPMLPTYGFVSLYSMNHIGAVRFALPIDQGEPVLDATVNLFVDSDDEDDPDFGIYIQDTDDAETFTADANNLSTETRPRSDEFARMTAEDTGSGYLESPSLASLVQVAVDRTEWVAGNHIALLLQPLSDSNRFEFRQFDYSDDSATPGDFAAFLDISYVELTEP